MRARPALLARLASAALAAALTASCLGTTGSALVTFPAYASGPADAAAPLVFDSGRGFHVTLTAVTMHIGAAYVTASVLNQSSQSSSCIEPGRYIAQVPGSADVDLLSPAPQPFLALGSGTSDPSETAEVWLTGGDVNADEDATPVVTIAGTARRGADSYPFEARVTIGGNRKKPVSDPAQPGLNPICKRRIIEVSPVRVRLAPGGALRLRVDPRGWFNSVDFSALDLESSAPLLYSFPDSDSSGTTGEAAGRSLFTGILTGVLPSGESAYSFTYGALP
jgi:hypothetical protein